MASGIIAVHAEEHGGKRCACALSGLSAQGRASRVRNGGIFPHGLRAGDLFPGRGHAGGLAVASAAAGFAMNPLPPAGRALQHTAEHYRFPLRLPATEGAAERGCGRGLLRVILGLERECQAASPYGAAVFRRYGVFLQPRRWAVLRAGCRRPACSSGGAGKRRVEKSRGIYAKGFQTGRP